MLTLEQIKEKLQDRNLTKVAKAVDLTRPFLSGIRSGKVPNPSYDTIKRLSDYLEK